MVVWASKILQSSSKSEVVVYSPDTPVIAPVKNDLPSVTVSVIVPQIVSIAPFPSMFAYVAYSPVITWSFV